MCRLIGMVTRPTPVKVPKVSLSAAGTAGELLVTIVSTLETISSLDPTELEEYAKQSRADHEGIIHFLR